MDGEGIITSVNHTSFSPPTFITHQDDLIAYLESGCKPDEATWRIGTEHEKFGFRKTDLTPIPYHGPDGIATLLTELSRRFRWREVTERGHLIALTQDHASITLEPGGQLELSGAPLTTIHETQAEINQHLHQLGEVCRDLGIAFLGTGTQPKWSFSEIPWMPKERYRLMRSYLARKDRLGLDMMARTATVQVNVDFGDESDMVRKFRLSLALQPLITALFANAPFLDGRPTGFLSYRAKIWQHTDSDRCGWLPFVFEDGFDFERYVRYALDVPMLFLYRDGVYRDACGEPFRHFLERRLTALPGIYPTLEDWSLHLTTLFPEVRLKHYLELRGADAGNSATLCALPAFWKGLLYDSTACHDAWSHVRHWSLEDHARIHAEAPRLGLKTSIPGKERDATLQTLAEELLHISATGLSQINARNEAGCDESIYLEPLFQTVESGRPPALNALEAYHTRWERTVDPIFREMEFESFYAEC